MKIQLYFIIQRKVCNGGDSMICSYDERQHKFSMLKLFIENNRDMKGLLMPVMQKAQEIFGYLPMDVQNFIAEEIDIPLTEVYGVSTFYSQFKLKQVGEYNISVCLGTACYVKGSQKIIDKIQKILNIKVGDTTEDGKFTLNAARCLGACSLAPVMKINDKVYGRLVPEDIEPILNRYK